MSRTVILILFVTSAIFPQHPKLNSAFFNTWLEYGYFQEIENGKKPYEIYSLMKPVMQIFFYPGTDTVLIGSFNEGMHYKYSVMSENELNITGGSNFCENLSLIYKDGRYFLLARNGNDKYELAALDNKYYKRNGVDDYINDKLLAGEYYDIANSGNKIIFSTDGIVSGIEGYNKYRVPLFKDFPIGDTDIVLLFNLNPKGSKSTLLHYVRYGDYIKFYEIKEFLELRITRE